jgi:hypothetical protein
MKPSSGAAVVLDRDATLIEEVRYPNDRARCDCFQAPQSHQSYIRPLFRIRALS